MQLLERKGDGSKLICRGAAEDPATHWGRPKKKKGQRHEVKGGKDRN